MCQKLSIWSKRIIKEPYSLVPPALLFLDAFHATF